MYASLTESNEDWIAGDMSSAGHWQACPVDTSATIGEELGA